MSEVEKVGARAADSTAKAGTLTPMPVVVIASSMYSAERLSVSRIVPLIGTPVRKEGA